MVPAAKASHDHWGWHPADHFSSLSSLGWETSCCTPGTSAVFFLQQTEVPSICTWTFRLGEAPCDDQSLQMWDCFSLSVESLIWFISWGSNPLVLPVQAACRKHRPALTSLWSSATCCQLAPHPSPGRASCIPAVLSHKGQLSLLVSPACAS